VSPTSCTPQKAADGNPTIEVAGTTATTLFYYSVDLGGNRQPTQQIALNLRDITPPTLTTIEITE
jgi:uncharacterized protein YtpQ (UPF0354 family)